jgi:hypothetical protein
LVIGAELAIGKKGLRLVKIEGLEDSGWIGKFISGEVGVSV